MTELSAEPAAPEDYLPEDPAQAPPPTATAGAPTPAGATDFADAVTHIIAYAEAQGFVVAPWHIATFVTAIRTKPLVVLAGISGTGKSSLPRVVSRATGSTYFEVPVNPDWTDSGELVGHRSIEGEYVPGPLIRAARQAEEVEDSQHFFMLDEVNLARVEYYLAEVLSIIEARRREDGDILSPALHPISGVDAEGTNWSDVTLPSNLAIVGSVNMDESTFTFARKVLDRMFVLELSDVDLDALPTLSEATARAWSALDWSPPYLNASEMGRTKAFEDTVAVLKDVNDILQPLQQHVGYRVRDEIAIFSENAQACLNAFEDRDGSVVDPLDLALFMKVLPRIQGASTALSRALEDLDDWANGQNSIDRSFPRCQERIALMRQRLKQDGAASFWV